MKEFYLNLIIEGANKALNEYTKKNSPFDTPDEEGARDNLEDYRRAVKEGKLLKRISVENYTLMLYQMDSKSYDGFILFGKELVGSLLSTNRGYVKNFPQIYYGYVLKAHQGHGLNTKLRQLIIDTVGGIVSDLTISDAAIAVFKKLGAANNISLYLSNKKIVPFDEKLAEHDKGALIVVSKKPLI
jgi:GNAT superfamily N-acetyltransferase